MIIGLQFGLREGEVVLISTELPLTWLLEAGHSVGSGLLGRTGCLKTLTGANVTAVSGDGSTKGL